MAPHPHPPSRAGRQRQRPAAAGRRRPPILAIMETSAVVGVLSARYAGRPAPRWFEDGMRGGRIAVPRTVEVELKRLRKSNRRGAGRRADLSWLARLRGSDLEWVYGLYRSPPIDAGVQSRIAAMHGAAVRDPGGQAAAAWLRSKRTFVRGRLGLDPSSLSGHRAGRALSLLSRAAGNDRDIMAQAVAIASAAASRAPPGAASGPPVLVSRDGDFTAFAGPLEDIAGGSMRVVHYARM